MALTEYALKYPLHFVAAVAIFGTFLFFPFLFLLLLVPDIYKIIKGIFSGKDSTEVLTKRKVRTKPSSTLSPNTRRMTTAEYHAYLQSPKWKEKVSLIQQRDKVCKLTGATTQLEVHHITYDRLGNEDLSDLVLLSRKAHQFVHDYYGSYSHDNTYPIDNLRNLL